MHDNRGEFEEAALDLEELLRTAAPLPADPLEFLNAREPRGPVRILYEDEHMLLVFKPANLLTQPDATGDPALPDLVRAYLAEGQPPRPEPIYCEPAHRLDRPVSGVVAMAKTPKALEGLTTAFRERTVEKVYWALVLTCPKEPAGTLTHWLVKNERRNMTVAHPIEIPNAWWSQLSYRVLGPAGPYWLLEVRPLTGRPHQIRVQLATGLGCAIVGDLKYGAPVPLPDFRIALHARRLTVPHPITGLPVTAEAPLPEALPWRLLQ